MQVMDEAEMATLIRACLPELDEIEAAFVQECWLQEPRVPLTKFSKQWHLSGKAVAELQNRVLVRPKNMLALKDICSVMDVM